MSDVAFEHYALLYRDAGEYLDGVLRFVAPGLDAGEPVVAAVPWARLELLRAGLEDAADRVELIDMTEFGRNPGRIIAGVQAKLDAHDGRLVHYVGEPIWPGRSEEEICEATRHEALINLAFADAPIRVLCPYDAARLDATILANAECTHPHLLDGGTPGRPSPRFGGYLPPTGCDEPFPPSPAGTEAIAVAPAGLARVRRHVAEHAAAAGLDPRRAEELVLAANEIATNSLQHAGPGGTLRVWRDGGRVVCEVRDAGHIADPLAGRRPPAADDVGGRGLWLVHQLCDLVETRTSRAGTSVRLHAGLV